MSKEKTLEEYEAELSDEIKRKDKLFRSWSINSRYWKEGEKKDYHNKETIALEESLKKVDYLKKAIARKKKIMSDDSFRIRLRVSGRVQQALARQGSSKCAKSMEYVGCSKEQLINYLELKFTDGMSWDNYGKWHIDHIRPCASFDLTDPGRQRECFHYTNLQPLWAKDNLRKSDKWDGRKRDGKSNTNEENHTELLQLVN
jgi:hypothetical protein